jgi:hypothetical protein
MAYLHCHNCDFSQDDFWSKDGYNPFGADFISWYKNLLFKEPDEFGPEPGKIKATEFVAQELERKATLIRGMVYRTEKEFRDKNPDWICPKCGKQQLDID